jgi:hypothetical protein
LNGEGMTFSTTAGRVVLGLFGIGNSWLRGRAALIAGELLN